MANYESFKNKQVSLKTIIKSLFYFVMVFQNKSNKYCTHNINTCSSVFISGCPKCRMWLAGRETTTPALTTELSLAHLGGYFAFELKTCVAETLWVVLKGWSEHLLVCIKPKCNYYCPQETGANSKLYSLST